MAGRPNLLTQEVIGTLYEQAKDLLATVGIRFCLASARDLFKKNGARVDGEKVHIPGHLLDRCMESMPKHRYEPAGMRRLVAGSPFSNAPMVLDDLTGQVRRGTVEDAVKMYQLAETSALYESVNPGVADPEGNDSGDQFIGQVAMLLKYSDKWPSLGLRATKSNTKDGDVRASIRQSIQLIREIREDDRHPVMSQGICPLAPLAWDEESLINLTVLTEEGQDISISPCTLSFMTGPESLMGIVIHDLAISLAGMAYIQFLRPGTRVGFSNFSTMTDMRTMQPVYACPEYLYVQIMFYEVCRYLEMNCALCGCFADGIRNDYQAGFESCLTALAPYTLTDVDQIWCYPGHMAAFAGGSFTKLILDEELMINCNRMLAGLDLSIDPLLSDKLARSIDTGSFLTIGDVSIYRKEQRVGRILDKRGIDLGRTPLENPVLVNVKKEIDRRCGEYTLPERSKAKQRLLQKYLPVQCKF